MALLSTQLLNVLVDSLINKLHYFLGIYIGYGVVFSSLLNTIWEEGIKLILQTKTH